MEKIVRPFQTADRSPSHLVTDASKEPAKNIVLRFGKPGGSASTSGGSASLNATWYMDKNEYEKSKLVTFG